MMSPQELLAHALATPMDPDVVPTLRTSLMLLGRARTSLELMQDYAGSREISSFIREATPILHRLESRR